MIWCCTCALVEERLSSSAGTRATWVVLALFCLTLRSAMMQLVVCSLLVVAVSVSGKDYGFQHEHDDAVRQLIGTLKCR